MLGGFLAGIVNTLAGNGSLITLSLLIESAALTPLMANATNRVGIAANCLASMAGFSTHQAAPDPITIKILIIIFLGGVAGGLTSIMVTNEQFYWIYKIILILIAVSLFFKPNKWLHGHKSSFLMNQTLLRYVIYLAIGFYGGFIQMGMGIFLLGILVLAEGMDILKANYIKIIAVLMYTIALLILYIWTDNIHWGYGLLLASGQLVGGWTASRYIAKWSNGSKIAYYMLVLVSISAIIKAFLL